jgi:hypothetical protein
MHAEHVALLGVVAYGGGAGCALLVAHLRFSVVGAIRSCTVS